LTDRASEGVKRTLTRVKDGKYPTNLPLERAWTLYFSDTSATTKRSSTHGATGVQQYSSTISPLFTISDVPTLCGSLKALSSIYGTAGPGRGARRNTGGGSHPQPEEAWSLGLAKMKQGMNFHFFRDGVEPVWEDKWNASGGRLTISPPPALLDALFLRLLLLLAGASLDHTALLLSKDSSYNPPPPPTPGSTRGGKPPIIGQGEGNVVGLVASRRNRGDRIEIWIAGRKVGEPPAADWIDRLKEALAREGMDEMRGVKYKKHF